MSLEAVIRTARGDAPADVLLTNARIVNVFSGEIRPGAVAIRDGVIIGLGPHTARKTIDLHNRFVAPGLIDAHVHIESSMASVAEFARTVLVRGTTTVVADPHEIANVLGADGIEYMLASSERQPLKVYFTLSSCVPASPMETTGAVLGPEALARLIGHKRVVALAEVMNYPGVIQADPTILKKIKLAKDTAKPVDGHAPGLRDKALNAYIAAGISSDHECTSAAEAMEKLRAGMHIMIRESTGAKNLEQLLPIVTARTVHRIMWCTDDRHPHDLLDEGHIDAIVRRAISKGLDPIWAIQIATLNPARYFGLHHLGAVAPGRKADLIVFSDLSRLEIEQVFADGELVAENTAATAHMALVPPPQTPSSMHVQRNRIDFRVPAKSDRIRVIEVIPDQIITGQCIMPAVSSKGLLVADPASDLLKLAVVDRHSGRTGIGIGFVRGFGLKKGALASSVAHDAHNIIVVGTTDAAMHIAVEAITDMGGGMTAVGRQTVRANLPLPIAGLMSPEPMVDIRKRLDQLIRTARDFGCTLKDPFMVLSFLALPVIPELKLTDHGLVDVNAFKPVSLFV